MKGMFSAADKYIKQSNWKDLALVKFCLCAVGIIIGILIPATKKKPVGIAAAVVFAITYVLLMPRYFVMLFKGGRDELIVYVKGVGFLPLFANDISGFSVEEHVASAYWWSGDTKKDPWEWREIIARSGEVAYGKFFNKKAGFISLDWLPYFVNYRRDGYDYDSRWEDGKMSKREKKIMDLFEEEGTELYSFEVKRKAGFGKDGEKNFDGTITGLMMQTYLTIKDFRRRKRKGDGVEYGWPVAVYATPEELWGYKHVTSAYKEEPEISKERIWEHIKKLYPKATDKQIKRSLG